MISKGRKLITTRTDGRYQGQLIPPGKPPLWIYIGWGDGWCGIFWKVSDFPFFSRRIIWLTKESSHATWHSWLSQPLVVTPQIIFSSVLQHWGFQFPVWERRSETRWPRACLLCLDCSQLCCLLTHVALHSCTLDGLLKLKLPPIKIQDTNN